MQARLEVQVRLRVRQDLEGELQAKVSSEHLQQAKTCEALRKVHGAPRTNWRVHNGVKKILSGYSISPKKYHGGALTVRTQSRDRGSRAV